VRILLDESVPVQVRNALRNHSVSTVVEIGWGGITNGELLDRAEAEGFQLLIVADKNFQYQQNLTGRQIAILELWTNHRPTLENHLERIRSAAESAPSGQIVALNEQN
jgi:predicted nuclease of predicted toxin-antitoxin system